MVQLRLRAVLCAAKLRFNCACGAVQMAYGQFNAASQRFKRFFLRFATKAPLRVERDALRAVQLNYQLSIVNYQLKSPTHVCEVGLSFLFSLLHPSYLTRPTTSQAFCKVKVIAVKEIARLSHFVIKLTLSAAKLKHLFQSCKHFVSFLRFRTHFVFSTS